MVNQQQQQHRRLVRQLTSDEATIFSSEILSTDLTSVTRLLDYLLIFVHLDK